MSDAIKMTGRVHLVQDTQTFASGFTKRVLVLDTGSKYDNLLPIEFKKEKAEPLADLKRGDEVTVTLDLGGREHNGKFYADVNGWGLRKLNADAPPAQKHESTGKHAETGDEGDGDDIPF